MIEASCLMTQQSCVCELLAYTRDQDVQKQCDFKGEGASTRFELIERCSATSSIALKMYASPAFVAAAVFVAWVIRDTLLAVWNTQFHPLKSFAGPRFAAATAWYKTWQEVFAGRSWVDVLHELHVRYGEVVRVGPNEVSANPMNYMYVR